jgi:hypothetical protein
LAPPTSLPWTLIAGTTWVKDEYKRDEGMSLIVSLLSVSCVRALVTSTTGVSPVTVIVSATPPTFMSAFTVAMNEPVSSIPSRLNVENPFSVKVSV